jgi:hypothetical protein
LYLSFIINPLTTAFFPSDNDLIWEAASSSDSDTYDPSQINTKHGSLSVRVQPQDRDRYNKNGCIVSQVRNSGWGGWNGAKERSAIYTDRSLSGILKMKAPLCLSRGGLVEVGLGKKEESTLRRLIYVRTHLSFLRSFSLTWKFYSGQAAQIHGLHSTKAKPQISPLTY